MEAEWLISAGYPELTKPFEQVRRFYICRISKYSKYTYMYIQGYIVCPGSFIHLLN